MKAIEQFYKTSDVKLVDDRDNPLDEIDNETFNRAKDIALERNAEKFIVSEENDLIKALTENSVMEQDD